MKPAIPLTIQKHLNLTPAGLPLLTQRPASLPRWLTKRLIRAFGHGSAGFIDGWQMGSRMGVAMLQSALSRFPTLATPPASVRRLWVSTGNVVVGLGPFRDVVAVEADLRAVAMALGCSVTIDGRWAVLFEDEGSIGLDRLKRFPAAADESAGETGNKATRVSLLRKSDTQ